MTYASSCGLVRAHKSPTHIRSQVERRAAGSLTIKGTASSQNGRSAARLQKRSAIEYRNHPTTAARASEPSTFIGHRFPPATDTRLAESAGATQSSWSSLERRQEPGEPDSRSVPSATFACLNLNGSSLSSVVGPPRLNGSGGHHTPPAPQGAGGSGEYPRSNHARTPLST